jgi:hypothetical protein
MVTQITGSSDASGSLGQSWNIKIVTTGFTEVPVLITASRYFSLCGKLSFPSCVDKGRWSSIIKENVKNMLRDCGLNLSSTTFVNIE